MSVAFFSNLWRCIIAGFLRETRYVISHPKAWIVGIVLPALWCLLLIGCFSPALMHRLPVALVNQDRSAESTALVSRLESLPSIKLDAFESPSQALSEMKSGRYYGYIHIPENFTRDMYSTRSSALEIYLNKSVYAIGVTLEIDVKQALLDYQKEAIERLALSTGVTQTQANRWLNTINVNTVNLGNIAMNFQAYLLPTLIPGILHLAMILMTITSLIRYFWDKEPHKEFGKSHAVIAGTALAKVLFWWSVYSVMGLVYLAWFAGYSGWALPESNILLWVVALLLLFFAMGCIALLLTALFIHLSPIIALSFATGYTAPIYPFTGFSFPLDSMTPGAQLFSRCLPLTYFIRLQSDAWILGSSFNAWFPTLAALLTFSIISLAIGLPLMVCQTRKMTQEHA